MQRGTMTMTSSRSSSYGRAIFDRNLGAPRRGYPRVVPWETRGGVEAAEAFERRISPGSFGVRKRVVVTAPPIRETTSPTTSKPSTRVFAPEGGGSGPGAGTTKEDAALGCDPRLHDVSQTWSILQSSKRRQCTR